MSKLTEALLTKEKNLNDHLLVGPIFHSIQTEKSFVDSDKILDYLQSHPSTEKTILIKGSRGIKLEKVLPVL